MKNAFTMMELIFVIVIIGILSAFAVPRLFLVKNDASVTSGLANLKILQDDINIFYARHSKLPDNSIDIKNFTNIKNINWKNTNTLEFIYLNSPCVGLEINNAQTQIKFIPLLNNNHNCKTFQFALAKNNLLTIENNKISEKIIYFGGGSLYDISSFN